MSAIQDHFVPNDIPGVTEIVLKIRSSLERSFPFIWVKGEITDLSRSPSGHIYFSLKDEQSLLRCVWFSWQQKQGDQKFNPLTGEIYENPLPNPAQLLQNGIEVICSGSIGFYAPGGICQLKIDTVDFSGIGLLAQAFEIVKQKLERQGFFESAHKKELPANPRKIALITSLHGAAIKDFLKISKNRGLPSKIYIYPVPVQGVEAPGSIVRAIKDINLEKWADIMVLIRGGGSREDLWCFNDEQLVKSIFDSQIPVLTGIGHEIDLSLSDLAADKSAATPTHAAQLLWPLRTELNSIIQYQTIKLQKSFQTITEKKYALLQSSQKELYSLSPLQSIQNKRQELAGKTTWLSKLLRDKLNFISLAIENSNKLLQGLSPENKLEKFDFQLATHKKNLQQAMEKKVYDIRKNLFYGHSTLFANFRNTLDVLKLKIDKLSSILDALNPEKPLSRGYALVFDKDHLIFSSRQVKKGDKLRIKFFDGDIIVKVEKDHEKDESHN